MSSWSCIGCGTCQRLCDTDGCVLLNSFSWFHCHGWIAPDGYEQGARFWEASNEALGMTGPGGLKGPPTLVQHAPSSVVMSTANKVNLKYEEAESELNAGLTRVLAGLF